MFLLFAYDPINIDRLKARFFENFLHIFLRIFKLFKVLKQPVQLLLIKLFIRYALLYEQTKLFSLILRKVIIQQSIDIIVGSFHAFLMLINWLTCAINKDSLLLKLLYFFFCIIEGLKSLIMVFFLLKKDGFYLFDNYFWVFAWIFSELRNTIRFIVEWSYYCLQIIDNFVLLLDYAH